MYTFPNMVLELKEQISETIDKSFSKKELRVRVYLLPAEYTFPQHGIELKEQISQMIKASQEIRLRVGPSLLAAILSPTRDRVKRTNF